MHFDKAHVLVNADYGMEKLNAAGDKTWFGANATLGYAMTDMFAIAFAAASCRLRRCCVAAHGSRPRTAPRWVPRPGLVQDEGHRRDADPRCDADART